MLPFPENSDPLNPDLIFDGYMTSNETKYSYKNCIELTMKGTFIYSIGVNPENFPPDYSDSMYLMSRIIFSVTEIQDEQTKILESILEYPTLSQSIRLRV